MSVFSRSWQQLHSKTSSPKYSWGKGQIRLQSCDLVHPKCGEREIQSVQFLEAPLGAPYSLQITEHWTLENHISDRDVTRYNFFLCGGFWPLFQSFVCPSRKNIYTFFGPLLVFRSKSGNKKNIYIFIFQRNYKSSKIMKIKKKNRANKEIMKKYEKNRKKNFTQKLISLEF